MKHVALAALLGAAQCGDQPPKPAPSKKSADVGQPDAGLDARATTIAMDWMQPGPAPFDVPTRRLELPEMDVSILAPVGTRVEKAPGTLHVKLGEGRNFWLEITDAAVDLGEVRSRLDSETSEIDRELDDVVVWNEEDRWYFQYAGTLACSNPPQAQHDRGDLEIMIAACRSLAPQAD